MPLSATAVLLAAVRGGRRPAASAPVFVALILLAALYIAWRAGWLQRGSGGSRIRAWRADLRELELRPLAFIPLLILVVVVVVLLVAH